MIMKKMTQMVMMMKNMILPWGKTAKVIHKAIDDNDGDDDDDCDENGGDDDDDDDDQTMGEDLPGRQSY